MVAPKFPEIFAYRGTGRRMLRDVHCGHPTASLCVRHNALQCTLWEPLSYAHKHTCVIYQATEIGSELQCSSYVNSWLVLIPMFTSNLVLQGNGENNLAYL